MSTTTALLLGAFVASMGLGLIVWSAPKKASLLDQRLGSEPAIPVDLDSLPEVGSLDILALNQPLSERFILPALSSIGKAVASKLPSKDLDALRLLIDQAGRPKGVSAEMVLAKQVIYAVIGGIVGYFLVQVGGFDAPLNIGAPFLSAMMGFTLPRTGLKRKQKKRKNELGRVLPDMVDLLTVSVEAGLSFEAALRRVCEKFDNDLSVEFQKALNEYRLGLQLNVALKEMADRLEVPAVQSVVRVILQSEQLGTSLGAILRIQSEQLRRDRRARAQELGQKAPVKMLLPMVGCIFPTIFIILLGPAVVHIISSQSSH